MLYSRNQHCAGIDTEPGSGEPVQLRRPAAYAQSAAGPSIGGCPVYPANNVWNTDVSTLPVAPNSANFIASIGASGHLHPTSGQARIMARQLASPMSSCPPISRRCPSASSIAMKATLVPIQFRPMRPSRAARAAAATAMCWSCRAASASSLNSTPAICRATGVGKRKRGRLGFELQRAAPATWTSADAAGLPICQD